VLYLYNTTHELVASKFDICNLHYQTSTFNALKVDTVLK